MVYLHISNSDFIFSYLMAQLNKNDCVALGIG